MIGTISIIMKAPHTLFHNEAYNFSIYTQDVIVSYKNDKTFSSGTKTYKTKMDNV